MRISILVGAYNGVAVCVECTHVERINRRNHGGEVQQVGGVELVVHVGILVLARMHIVNISAQL